MAKFIFNEANHEKPIKAFQLMCGIHFKGKRPDAIQLSRDDIGLLIAEPEKAIKWLQMARSALALEVVNG